MGTKPDEKIEILDVKLKQLLITCGRTVSVLESTKDIAINRQIESLKALSKDVEQSRREVELLKITNDEPEDELTI
jgi:predicted metal-dependent peptidase